MGAGTPIGMNRRPNRPAVVNGVPRASSQVAPTSSPTVGAPAPAGFLFEDSLPYAEPSFALAISHCPWRPDRSLIMQSIRKSLGVEKSTSARFQQGEVAGPYREIIDRAPNHVWSRIMWRWGAAQSVTHVVYLQDDLRIAPNFWQVVREMVCAVPRRVIGLISNHPLSYKALEAGHAWYRICETLGSGYIVPTVLMGVFLEWESRQSESTKRECEDFVLTRWQYETGRRSWCPIPTVIQTIDGIATTDPRVSYPYRRSYITWEDEPKSPISTLAYWQSKNTPPPDFGPTVGNDSRMARGPFADGEVLQAHARRQRRPR